MPDQVQGQGSLAAINPLPETNRPRESESTAAPDHQESAVIPMWQVIKRLPTYARLATALARDPRVPSSSKAMLVGAGLYLVSPIDLVPGFIPVAGQLDDLYVMLLGLRQAIRTSPAKVIDEHFATVGLQRACVYEDLATIRAFVWSGVVWTVRKGGQAVSRVSRQATVLAQRARQRGETSNDQESL